MAGSPERHALRRHARIRPIRVIRRHELRDIHEHRRRRQRAGERADRRAHLPSTTRTRCVPPVHTIGNAGFRIGRGAIDFEHGHAARNSLRILHGDLVASTRPRRNVMREPRPAAGMHGSTTRRSPRTRKPSIHSMPARYSHPAEPVYQRPPAAADVRLGDRRRRGTTYGSTGSAARRRAWPRACIGIEHRRYSSRGLDRLAELGKRDQRPRRGVRVLPAVLAHARHVSLDVAGFERRVVERRREQQHRARRRAHELLVERRMARRARSAVAGARDHGPRLRDRVDLARIAPASRAACRRRNRRAGTTRRPSLRAPRRRQAPSRATPTHRRASCSPRAVRDGRPLREHGVQEPRQPHALALALAPTRFMPSFQSPVPISGRPCAPDARDSDRSRARSARRACRAGRRCAARSTIRAVRRRAPAPSMNGDLLVENAVSPVTLEIVLGDIGQPEQIVRECACARRGPCGSCHQCCTSPSTNWRAGGAQDLRAREVGTRDGERHHVLQLVAEPVRAARLVEAVRAQMRHASV